MNTDGDGVACPSCGSRWHEVTHTEKVRGATRRRRRCWRCDRRFVTVERSLGDDANATRSTISAKRPPKP